MVDLGPGKGEEVFFCDAVAADACLLNMTEGNLVASRFAATPELVVGDIIAPINPSESSFSMATNLWLRRLVWTDDESNMLSLLRRLDLVETFISGMFKPALFGCKASPTS